MIFLCKTLWIYFSERNWFFMKIFPFINCVSTSIWKWHAIVVYSIYGIYESNASRENLCYIIWYINRNNCVVKNILIICLLLKMLMTTSWSRLKTLCTCIFLQTFIFIWRHFTMSQFSTGLFHWWEFMILHVFDNLHVCSFDILPDWRDP